MSQIPVDNVFAQRQWKKVVFVVWRFHVCPNDWQLNQFHINPKREMHNLSTSASKTTISFKLCSRVFNWILFSWIFFNRIFCSLSDRINLWGRTNRWSRSDKIYPTSSLSPIADMKHVRAPHETAGLKTSRLKLSLLHNSWSSQSKVKSKKRRSDQITLIWPKLILIESV